MATARSRHPGWLAILASAVGAVVTFQVGSVGVAGAEPAERDCAALTAELANLHNHAIAARADLRRRLDQSDRSEDRFGNSHGARQIQIAQDEASRLDAQIALTQARLIDCR